MSEERFARMETMLAFQDDTIQKLNDVIYKQQVQIEKLEEKVASLIDYLKNPSISVPDIPDEPEPPHY